MREMERFPCIAVLAPLLLLMLCVSSSQPYEYQGEGEVDEALYQGDIMLTEEQWAAVNSRKGLPYESNRWPNHTTGYVNVGFRFRNELINKPGVMKGIAVWQEHTCLRFTEVASDFKGHHLIFQHHATRCNSFVGRIPSMTEGQDINLSKLCAERTGIVVHEIGHAMGFHHEQARSDRDDYVIINWQNIKPSMESNFEREKNTLTYNIPYDYTSVMHYGSKSFSKNGNFTVIAKKPVAQLAIGSRDGLSFADMKLANLMYNCTTRWLDACGFTNGGPCQNGGYTSANCLCVCPSGTSGVNCETFFSPYTDAAVKEKFPYNEVVTTESIVSSVDYPTPMQEPFHFVKHLLAPECHTIKFVFSDFEIYDHEGCLIDKLIITESFSGPSQEFCGKQIVPGQTFESSGNSLLFLYVNYNYTSLSFANRAPGFNGSVTHVPIEGCIPTGNLTTNDSVTTSVAPTTTSAAPTTTSAAPTTTSAAPTTTSAAPTTTSAAPTTTSAAPTTTSAAPTTTSAAPTTTSAAPTTTSVAPTTTSAAPTTTPHPPRIHYINSGDAIALEVVQSTGPCLFTSTFDYQSNNYPSAPYAQGDNCNTWLSTSEPRFVRIFAETIKIHKKDALRVNSVFKQSKRLRSRNTGWNATLLSSSVNLILKARKKEGGFFNLRFEALNSNCHMVVKVEPGAVGTLIEKNYKPGTICEYWFETESDYGIELEFVRFNVGNRRRKSDYLLIDITGDRRYRQSSKRYKGRRRPPAKITSVGSKLNMLLNGLKSKRRAGYKLNFTTYRL